jgi:hypothetical protein
MEAYMRDPVLRRSFYRSVMGELGTAFLVGAVTVLTIVVGVTWFKPSPDPILLADNSVTMSAPVTEDTPGPVVHDTGVPNPEKTVPAPLPDRER